MDLKERITKVIAYSGLSLSEFADEIEVQRSSISHVTSGRNKPSLDFLIKIKKRFPEILWEWLIEGTGEMTQPKEEMADKNAQAAKPKPPSLPDLFSLINDDAFGITESEDTITDQKPKESDISYQSSDKRKISDSQPLEKKNEKTTVQNVENQDIAIKRIVFFYDNGKFETFEP